MPLKLNNTGQTILEVIVALALIVLFISGVVVIQLVSVKNLKYAQNKSLATSLAREQIERVRVVRDSAGIDELMPCIVSPCFINSFLTPVPLSNVTPTGTYNERLTISEADPSECPGGFEAGVPTPTPSSESIIHEGTSTNIAVDCLSVTTSVIPADNNMLYLITVGSHFGNINVNSVSGLGLTWTLRKRQCSGFNRKKNEIWSAYGSTSGGTITVNFTSMSPSCVIAVSRYSGVSPILQAENPEGSNTVGQNGVCSGGIDNSNAILNLTSVQNNSVLYVGSNTRAASISSADPDYTQRAVNVAGLSGQTTRLYIHDRILTVPATDTINHTLSAAVDWAMSGVVIRPASLGGIPTLTPQPVGRVYKAEAYISWGESGTITPAPEVNISSCITDWR